MMDCRGLQLVGCFWKVLWLLSAVSGEVPLNAACILAASLGPANVAVKAPMLSCFVLM